MIVTVDTEVLKETLKANCYTMCIDRNTDWCEHSCPLKRIEELLDKAMVDVAKPQGENKPLNWDTDESQDPEEETDDTGSNEIIDQTDGIADPTYINGIVDSSDFGIFPWGNS